mgnify:FL=1
MKLRDLYDENKELTGETIYKGQDVPKGRYYITVVVFIQNSKNEFLIQKRVKKKDGKWATIEEINELIKNEAFSEIHTEFFELCLDYLKLK